MNLFSKSSKTGILEWILNAETIERRKRRIREMVKLAIENVNANQVRKYKISIN